MDINEFKRAFFDVACDMQKLLHDLDLLEALLIEDQ